MKASTIGCLIVAIATSATGVSGQDRDLRAEPGEDGQTNRWRLQVGWVHQWGRSMEVSGPAPSLYNTLIPPRRPRRYSAGSYDDGYVYPDEQSDVDPGGNPDNPRSTHYWHYDNPGQYDAANHTIKFHREPGTRDVGAPRMTGSLSDTENLRRDGIEIKLSRWIHTWTNDNNWKLDLDLVAGVAWFPRAKTRRNSRRTEQSVVDTRETYTYRDYFGSPEGGGWQPSLDYWYPYYGTYRTNDDPPGDNPIIPLDHVVDINTKHGLISDTVLIEADLDRLRVEFGPMLSTPITSRLRAYIAPQLALEFLCIKLRRTETVTYTRGGRTREVGSQYDRQVEHEVVPGLLLTAGADYMLSENWFIGASAGWEWLFGDVEVKFDQERVRIDLDGGEFSLYLGRKF